jgi:hypothetical protein
VVYGGDELVVNGYPDASFQLVIFNSISLFKYVFTLNDGVVS